MTHNDKALGFFSQYDNRIEEISREIRKTIEKRNELCNVLKNVRFEKLFQKLAPPLRNNIQDVALSIPVAKTDLKGLHIAGVDGGLVSNRLQYLDVLLTRAVAVIFRYRQSGEIITEQLMSHESTPEITVKTETLSRGEFETLSTIRRAITEIDLARKVVEQKSVNTILLDGSILPHRLDRLVANSPIVEEYQLMLECYQQFYEICKDRGILAVGCIKDSKITHFRDKIMRALPTIIQQWREDLKPLLTMNYRHILLSMFDSEFFYRLLEPQERSCCFPLKDKLINSEAQRFSDHLIHCYYLKTVPRDFPLRVEFLTGNEDPPRRADQIASVLYPLSSHHAEYGLPSILIEADARARLHQADLDLVIESIITRIGFSDPWRLRRERSVFYL